MAKDKGSRGGKSAGTQVRFRGRQADLYQQAKAGELDCSDWDMEELIRGYRRNTKGNFAGRPPAVVPREVHDELAKRVKTQVAHELRGLANEHIRPVYEAVLKGQVHGIAPEDVPGLKLQLEAAKDLMDRFVVTKKDQLEISGTLKHEAIIDNVTVERDLPEEDIVDAEVLDEWDELDEWED